MEPVQEQLLAYNDRDLERFLAAYSPEVLIQDDAGNVAMKGLDQMRERYGALFAAGPQLHAEIVNRIKLGNRVVDHERVEGMPGSATPVEAIVIYRVEGDKIVHVRMLT